MPEDLDKLARRVAKIERALEATIEHTGSRATVDAAESAYQEEAAKQHQETVEKLSALSKPHR